MSLTSAAVYVPRLLFDPRGTISRRAFAWGSASIILVLLVLHFFWWIVWALSFDGCTRYVPEIYRQALIKDHMLIRAVMALVVFLLLFSLFGLIAKRRRSLGLPLAPIFYAAGVYAVVYAAGWLGDYWHAYNCGDVDRAVPRQREIEKWAQLVWLIALDLRGLAHGGNRMGGARCSSNVLDLPAWSCVACRVYSVGARRG